MRLRSLSKPQKRKIRALFIRRGFGVYAAISISGLKGGTIHNSTDTYIAEGPLKPVTH